MKKKVLLLGFYIVLSMMMFCGYSEKQTEQTTEPIIEPITEQITEPVENNNQVTSEVAAEDDKEQDSIENSEETDNTESEPQHLEYYEEFGMYNTSWDYFKGFVLTEEKLEGELYYQLWNEEKDVKILIDKTQENAVIYHNGKLTDYKMEYLITGTTAHAAIDVMDITNDDNDELIIYHGCGGTGVWAGDCEVFDLDTMQEYKIENAIYELESRITVEPMEIIEDDYLKCKITDVNSDIYEGKIGGAYVDISEYSYTPSDSSSYYSIEVDYDRKCLNITTGIVISPMFCNYLGMLHSYLEYNPKSECFELTDNLSVEVSEPLDK
ncbi:MAG: hypothetical protein WBI07_21690 [Mobilitalea sp.]